MYMYTWIENQQFNHSFNFITVVDSGFESYGGQSGARKLSSGMIEVQKRRAAKEKKQKESILKENGGLGSKGDSKQRGDKNTDAV